MINLAVSNIKHVICDYDGVLYDNALMAPYEHMWNICRFKISQVAFPSLPFEELTKLSEMEFEDYLEILISRHLPKDPTQKQVLDCKQKEQSLFHKNLFELVTPHSEIVLFPTRSVTNDFYNLKKVGVTFGILTLADKKEWVEPQIEYMGLQNIFSYILDYHGIKFLQKEFSPEPVAPAMKLAGTTPKETIFLEDNPRNLKMAKESFPEMTTIWINSKEEKPEFVDYQVDNLKQALNQVNRLIL
jgi:FMN phosphatase YigB (HAD superfamily)